MDIKKALEIKKAIVTLSDALNIDFQDVASRVCFFNKDQHKILVEASDKWNEFEDADIVERGAMLGITITKGENQ